MTPIKEIWVLLDTVQFLDNAGKLNLMAVCGSDEGALATGKALAKHHGVPLFAFSISLRQVVEVSDV